MARQHHEGALSLADEICEAIRLSSPTGNGIGNSDALKRLIAERKAKDLAGFKNLTLEEYRDFLALLEMDELEPEWTAHKTLTPPAV